MPWQDQLQKASFRGVEFQVEADDAAFGRRVQLHEYPQRDKPYAEDIGRRAREIGLTAFLIGPEYMAARDRLLAAIEEPGPGTLVHPWYGQLTVVVKDDGCRVTHSRDEGGLCRIQLAFVEAGELAFPSAASAAGAQTLLAADGMQELAIDEFAESFSLDGVPAWVSADAVATAASMLETLESALSTGVLANPVGTLLDGIDTLLATPTSYAQRVFGLFAKGAAIVQSVNRFADFSTLNFMRALSAVRSHALFGKSSRPAVLTPSSKRMYDNRDALAVLTRRASLVQAAGMTASMPLPVYDDAVALRRETLAALDAEAVEASDTAYSALVDLRANVHRDMTARLRDSARLRELMPREIVPAIVLAYDLYEDPAREPEIIARNRIRHPGFVPAEPIKVLSA